MIYSFLPFSQIVQIDIFGIEKKMIMHLPANALHLQFQFEKE